jgi:hypothetical protein
MSAVPQSGGVPFGERGLTETVREATANAGRRVKTAAFDFTRAGSGEKVVAVLLGIYLAYAVARLPEVFPVLVVPRLPMVLLATFMLLLATMFSPQVWEGVWKASIPLKCVAILLGLAIITAPIGIWMGGSIAFIRNRYIIAVVIFVACLVFLRDRNSLRLAASVFVLAVASIAIYTLATYDPNPQLFNQYGVPLDPSEVSIDRLRPRVSLSLDSNDWGAIVATTVPLALWLSFGSFLRRLFWTAIAIVIFAGVVPTASRGSLLGLVAAGLVLVGVGATGWRRWMLTLIMIGAGFVFAAIATDGQLQRFFDFSGDDYNLQGEGRWYFWRQGIVWTIKRPTGYGIANYGTYFDWLNGYSRAAHSMWVQYGVELGVAGLCTIVYLCWYLVNRNRKLRRLALQHRKTTGDVFDGEAVLNGHMLAMLAGVLVTGSFLSNAYYPLTYMALGIAAAALLGSPFRDQLETSLRGGAAPPVVSAGPQPERTRGVTRLPRRPK